LRDIGFPNIGLEYLITHEKARQRRAISLTLLSKLGCGEAQHPILAIGSNNDPAPGRVGLVESKSASFLNDFNGISGETADSRCAYRKSSPSILVMQSTEDRTAQNSPPPPILGPGTLSQTGSGILL
jgi:hypothetical protein